MCIRDSAKLANSINSAIAANTAKTSNATHTGDVTGSTALTIADDAVTTAKIADDAVTAAKIADGTVTATQMADNSSPTRTLQNSAVTTIKIADEAVTLAKLEHGTSSNDGKFLRANNGADPTFETVSMSGGVPSGGIIIWSGAANAIPTGYVLCDGNNSTPDLRDRFVVGAQNAYSVGDTGGSNTATDTVSISVSVSGTTGYPIQGGTNYPPQTYSYQDNTYYYRNHTHNFSGSGSGSDTVSIDTRSPYYALCYIMKT